MCNSLVGLKSRFASINGRFKIILSIQKDWEPSGQKRKKELRIDEV